MFVLSLKIVVTACFFGLNVDFVVDNLNNRVKLRNFFNIDEPMEITYIN